MSAKDLEIVAFDPDVVTRLAVRPEYEAAEREQRRAAAQAERERVESEQIRAEMLGWLVDGPRKAMLEKNGAPTVVFQKELRDETNRLANLNHAQLVEEVTRRREVRRIKGLGAKEYRAEVAISRAAGEQPVAQPKMTQAINQQYQPGTTYTTRDGITFELTRKSLIEAANRNPALFREIVRNTSPRQNAPPPPPAPPTFPDDPFEPLEDGSMPLPIDATPYEQRRASIAQMKNLVTRLRKFEVWQREQHQEPQ